MSSRKLKKFRGTLGSIVQASAGWGSVQVTHSGALFLHPDNVFFSHNNKQAYSWGRGGGDLKKPFQEINLLY